jgi:TDG/mug DNA glycosylase family protein
VTKAELKSSMSKGFAPISDASSRVLILGSLPGQTSLAAGQYYAQKQNAFWRIIGHLTATPADLSYEKRKQLLMKNRIALWDVCAAAERKGSLDSNIRLSTVVANDFDAFLKTHKKIRLICFNGQFAERLFRRQVLTNLSISVEKIRLEILPSTSPAHAAMPFEEKLEQWKILLL